MSASIGIFIPHLGCRHTCSFCNQIAITDTLRMPDEADLRRAVAASPPSAPAETELAFFGGSFTAIPHERLTAFLEAGTALVEEYGLKGIRLSTRPDAVGEDICRLLRRYPVTTVELGAQSMDDDILIRTGRGHTARQVEEGATRVRSHGFSFVLQMMTGLPGDSGQASLETARRLIALKPDGVRIYPTLVLRHSELEQLYHMGQYEPETLEGAVALCGQLADLFEAAGIPIVKMGLHAAESFTQDELVAGPYHPAFRELVDGARYLERALERVTRLNAVGKRLELTVATGHTSRMAGHGGVNRAELLTRTGAYRLSIKESPSLPPMAVEATVSELKK